MTTRVERHGRPQPWLAVSMVSLPWRSVITADRWTLDDNDVFLQWNGMGDRNLGSPLINRMVSGLALAVCVITADRWKLEPLRR